MYICAPLVKNNVCIILFSYIFFRLTTDMPITREDDLREEDNEYLCKLG